MKPLAAAVLLFAPILVPAQEESGRLIRFSVVATDNHNQPIGDLNQDDFEISENGKPRKIAFFHKSDTQVQNSGAPLGPHEFSNRSGVTLPRVTVILFDLLDPYLSEQGRMLDQLERQLPNMESADDLYFYLLTHDGMFPIRGLPEGTAPAALTGVNWTSHLAEMLKEPIRHVSWSESAAMRDINMRIPATYDALAALAWRLESIPGRKNVVWITHGIPISISPQHTVGHEGADLSGMMARLGTILDRAGVALYPVDLNAPAEHMQMSALDAGSNSNSNSRGGGNGKGNTSKLDNSAGLGGTGTAEDLAGLTGGRPYLNSDAAGAIKQALEDARLSYTVGYYDSGEPDSKFHKLQVKCARHGVRILVKKGFYAYPLSAATENSAIGAATSSPFDASEIGVRAAVSPGKQAQLVHLRVRIDAGDVMLRRQADVSEGNIAITFAVYEADGQRKMAPIGSIQFHMTKEQLATALANGMTLDRDLSAPDSIQKIRCVVYDRNSGSVGSVTVPLTPADRGTAQ